MIKYLFLLILLVNISCNAQKNKLMIPEIDNKFEKFDSIKYSYLHTKNPHNTNEVQSDGSYVEMIKLKESRYFYTPKDSYFTLVKLYHNNLNIKKKGVGINTGAFTFKLGIWYEFDEQGNLIKETDYDKPFKFTFEDILKFCEKENIEIKKGPISQSGWHNIISRKIETDKPIWKIERLKRSDLVEIITLDGITGKVIKRETEEYLNN